MSFEFNGKVYETDEEGYLADTNDWSEELAVHLAKEENIEMTPDHWEVVNYLRDYFLQYQVAPAVRVLCKTMGKKLGPEKGTSQFIYKLFPYGPAKQACKIAGLTKPTGCI